MQVAGAWIDENGRSSSGTLWAWGEWEAQSTRLRDLDPSGEAGLPHRLWQPFYIPMCDYSQLHNTDPFIFGDQFLYSNCQQWGRAAQWPASSQSRFGHRVREQAESGVGP